MVRICHTEISNVTIVSLTASVALFICSIIVMSIGGSNIHYAGDVENVPNFAPVNCTISAVQVVILPKCAIGSTDFGGRPIDKWIAVWQCQETGASIVENPFAAKLYKQSATNDQGDYSLGASQVVMCNAVNPPVTYPNSDYTPNTGCQVWSTCFFDVTMIEYMKANGKTDKARGFALLFTGLALLGLCLIFVIVYVKSWPRSTSYSAV
jgi:hypothetical protein